MRQQVDAAHSREAAARNVQERLGGASGTCELEGFGEAW